MFYTSAGEGILLFFALSAVFIACAACEKLVQKSKRRV